MTYTPSLDRIPPLPDYLHLRIKNTASVAFRAAYLHGPYTAYVSVRRQEFHPYQAWESKIEGDELEVPQYDPNLKAGANFYTILKIPEKLREDAVKSWAKEAAGRREGGPVQGGSLNIKGDDSAKNDQEDTQSIEADGEGNGKEPKSVTWIIEIISQTIFSTKATVGFELLVGRDEKSLSHGLGFGSSAFQSLKSPLLDNSEKNGKGNDTGTDGSGGESTASGVFSPSIKLKVQDTADLWNLPPFPSWSEENSESSFPEDKGSSSKENEAPDPDELDEREQKRERDETARRKKRVTKKVHLVIITHGLHSNTGADMLFMKEAIDDETRKAEKAYQEKRRAKQQKDTGCGASSDSKSIEDEVDDSDREMTIVRGFHENVCRTERGIKYLGKRLAKYVLALANPEQPNPHPLQKPPPRTPNKLRKQNHHPHLTPAARNPSYTESSPRQQSPPEPPAQPPYKVTSISFIGHSLGGLVQTYAIAFIHAHHPEFFNEAKPINFVALASPFLGLSNENPIYIKFALDFGLVGRTGQDLGLTWRAPNMAASALNALANHAPFSNSRDVASGNGSKADITKPLLRILPTGPAHEVFKMFRNRTVYANVVNDGIVPLRTSCLLYLDWKGLEKVEKARRENQVAGLVGWGWQQLTTGNSGSSPRVHTIVSTKEEAVTTTSKVNSLRGENIAISTEENNQRITEQTSTIEDAPATGENGSSISGLQVLAPSAISNSIVPNPILPQSVAENTINPFSSLMTLFRPQAGRKPSQDKIPKIYHRSQITPSGTPPVSPPEFPSSPAEISRAASPTNLHDLPSINETAFTESPAIVTSYDDFDDPFIAPPRTSILEAAGDVLNPPLPTVEFIINPNSRPRTIWHDRVYHSEDIPLPPSKNQSKSMLRRMSPGSGDINGFNGPIGSNGPSLQATSSSDASTSSLKSATSNSKQQAQLKVEEKIARAYHKDLSWRKVLVRLEPDAHNNIVVRRMFANAYGWPVVRHLVDTHFADTPEAKIADVLEGRGSRPTVNADQKISAAVVSEKPEVKKLVQHQSSLLHSQTSNAEAVIETMNRKNRSTTSSTEDSGIWDDAAFDTDDDEKSDDEEGQAEGTGRNTPKAGNSNKNIWTGGLNIKWPLEALGMSNVGEGEHGVESSEEQIDSFLKTNNAHGHAAAPIAAISKIDAWAHGSNSGENTPRSGGGGGSARQSIDDGRSFLLDDATKIGLATGGSNALRELGKFKKSSGAEDGRGSTSNATSKLNDERADEGVAERVARLGFRR